MNSDLGCLALILITVFVGVIGTALILDSTSCSAKADKMGVPHSWGVFSDCQIWVDGKWIPLSSYRVVGIEK